MLDHPAGAGFFPIVPFTTALLNPAGWWTSH